MAYEQLKLDNQVCFRLYTAARLVVQGYQPFLSKLGITYTQYLVLMVLWEKDSLPVGAIVDRLHLDTNNVTPLVKRMESEGLVKREKGSRDARQAIVSLTPKGKKLQKQASSVPGCLISDFKECNLDTDTLSGLVPYLDEIIEKLALKAK